MEKQTIHPNYGPSEYDFDFTFEFKLTFSDYILLGVYIIFAVPVISLIHLAEFFYLKIKDIRPSHRKLSESKATDHAKVSLFSKLF